jgi:hypothetical protein
MIKPVSKISRDAAVCIVALGILKRLGLAQDVSKLEVVRRLEVSRSYAYEVVPRVEAALAHELNLASDNEADAKTASTMLELQVRNAVLEYRVEHPGAWVCGGRTIYSKDLVAFILELAARSLGPLMTQAEFAAACGIPLATLKDWWADDANHQLPLPFAPAAETATATAAETATATAAETATATAAETATATEPTDAATLGLSAEMLRIVAEYENWHGTLPTFVKHLRTLDIHRGREMVAQILHLAAARKLLRRPPPKPPARGSLYRPPPGVQWTSDGKQLDVIVDDQTLRVTWQPTVDVGSTATVGSVVRAQETTEGVGSSFAEGVQTTGKAPAAHLLDNKACNKSPQLEQDLAPDTFVMHSTVGRPENKAVVEGSFGLFTQTLGPVVAAINTSSPQTIALSVADAVTRAEAMDVRPMRSTATPTLPTKRLPLPHSASSISRNASTNVRPASRPVLTPPYRH